MRGWPRALVETSVRKRKRGRNRERKREEKKARKGRPWRRKEKKGKRGDEDRALGFCSAERGWDEPLRYSRVQKEKGPGRCAVRPAEKGWRAGTSGGGRGEPGRNEKECNKLAVRLFSTCIKTSSGDGRPGKYCPTPSTPLFFPFHPVPTAPPFSPHREAGETRSPTTWNAKDRGGENGGAGRGIAGSAWNDLRPCARPAASRTRKIMLGLISRRCERAPSEFVNSSPCGPQQWGGFSMRVDLDPLKWIFFDGWK